jgi:hypothetical protein
MSTTHPTSSDYRNWNIDHKNSPEYFAPVHPEQGATAVLHHLWVRRVVSMVPKHPLNAAKSAGPNRYSNMRRHTEGNH